jgi:type I restriction enzyme S subunit
MKQLQSSYYFEKVHVDSLLGRIVAGKSSVGVDTAPSDGEYGVIKVSAVDPRGFLPHESKRLLNPDDFNPDFSLHAGDLLITRANTPELVGEVCLVERDHANLMLCDKTLRLEPRAGVDPYLLWETLQGEDVRRQLKAAATGTGRAMKNISQPTIRSLKMPFPLDRRVADKARARLLASRKAARAIQGRVDRNKGLMHSLRERLLRQAER